MSPGSCPAGLTPRGRPFGHGAVPLPVRRTQTTAPRIARPRAVARVAMGRQWTRGPGVTGYSVRIKCDLDHI
ncbi:hypothetical protein APB19_30450 [Pseudomonas aeruginosa]|nr:hypothetical protein [Pseudomonas aeruginosa]NBY86895.1 hypothetical protein [Pseudomonas aeruginosa]OPE27176.1 hypothetical protein APB19_30450 [Pseudomonas aeruginosa]RUK31665.1 hypothetical protein IPC245_06350 [Pseudomonas aeruginosa]